MTVTSAFPVTAYYVEATDLRGSVVARFGTAASPLRLDGAGSPAVAKPSPATAGARVPLTHRWWLWTGIVAGVALVGGGIALAASVAARPDSTVLVFRAEDR